MKRIYLLTAVLVFLIMNVQGQGNRDVIDAEKAAFFTRQLDISPEEAKLFWPVYNEFTDKRDKIVQEKNELTKKAATNFRDMTDKELEEYGDRLIELDLREAKLKSEYHAKFKEVLPAGKVVRLYYAERRFKTYLLNKLRSRRQNMPAAGNRRF